MSVSIDAECFPDKSTEVLLATPTNTKLLIATGNSGKVRELTEVLSDLQLQLVTLTDQGIGYTVEETGDTLEENALLKARDYGKFTGLPALADDSGLEVDALGGEPGVHAKTYAGENATDEERVRFLLSRLDGIGWEQRSARFRCVIALVLPSGLEELCEGVVEGIIAFEPRGKSGFGYDPIFYLPEFEKTMAELDPNIKNRVSHRGKAVRQAMLLLQRLMKQEKLL